jgi:hypothetical protein
MAQCLLHCSYCLLMISRNFTSFLVVQFFVLFVTFMAAAGKLVLEN